MFFSIPFQGLRCLLSILFIGKIMFLNNQRGKDVLRIDSTSYVLIVSNRVGDFLSHFDKVLVVFQSWHVVLSAERSLDCKRIKIKQKELFKIFVKRWVTETGCGDGLLWTLSSLVKRISLAFCMFFCFAFYKHKADFK